MLRVTRYSQLCKKDVAESSHRVFQSLRAVGLAVEAGWKASLAKGFRALTAEDFSELRVAGDLKVAGKSLTECCLVLTAGDASLALAVVQKQRDLLNTLDFNTWRLDYWKEGMARPMDMVAKQTMLLATPPLGDVAPLGMYHGWGRA